MTTTVRQFSVCGPCIPLGTLIKQTTHFYCYADERGSRAGKVRKRTPDHYSPNHIEPCPSCRDHTRTQYPNGYMD